MAIAVFNRAMTVEGRRYEPGYPVPEGVIPERRLKQLISLRRVVIQEEALPEGLVEEAASTPAAPPTNHAATQAATQVLGLFSSPETTEVEKVATGKFTCNAPGCERNFDTEEARNVHEVRMH